MIPSWETKTLQVVWCSQKKKKFELVRIHGSMSRSDTQGYTHTQDTDIFNSIHTCNDINTYNVCHKRTYKYTHSDIHIINTLLLYTYTYTYSDTYVYTYTYSDTFIHNTQERHGDIYNYIYNYKYIYITMYIVIYITTYK